MPTRIGIIHRIISAVRIQIQSVNTLWIKVACIIRRYKPSPLGIVVSRVQIVKLCFPIVVITSVANRIYLVYICVGSTINYLTVSVCVVCVFTLVTFPIPS